LHLTPHSSLHLLITENNDDDNNNNDEDSSDDDDDNDHTATTTDDDDDDNDDDADTKDDPDDLFLMAKTVPKKKGAAAGGRKAAPKKKTTGETIDLDTPPRKKPRAAAARYSSGRGAVTLSTPTPTAQRTRMTSCSTRGFALQECPAPGLPPTWREDTERTVEDIGEALLRDAGNGAGLCQGLLPLHGIL